MNLNFAEYPRLAKQLAGGWIVDIQVHFVFFHIEKHQLVLGASPLRTCPWPSLPLLGTCCTRSFKWTIPGYPNSTQGYKLYV